jgi:hypothetical protein
MVEMKKVEKCGAVLVDRDGTYCCELRDGHCKHPSQKHRFEGISWTVAGAARIARELAAEAAKKQTVTGENPKQGG